MNGDFAKKQLGGTIKPLVTGQEKKSILSRLKLKRENQRREEPSQDIGSRLKLADRGRPISDEKWRHDKAPYTRITLPSATPSTTASTSGSKNIVVLKNLSDETTLPQISELFRPCDGLKWVKMDQGDAEIFFDTLQNAKKAAQFADSKFVKGKVISAEVKGLRPLRERSRSAEALNSKIEELVRASQKKLEADIKQLISSHKKS